MLICPCLAACSLCGQPSRGETARGPHMERHTGILMGCSFTFFNCADEPGRYMHNNADGTICRMKTIGSARILSFFTSSFNPFLLWICNLQEIRNNVQLLRVEIMCSCISVRAEMDLNIRIIDNARFRTSNGKKSQMV